MNEDARPTNEQIANAGRLVGLEFTEDECSQMAQRLAERADHFERLREGPFARLGNHDAPSLYFDPRLPRKGSVPAVKRHYRLADAPETQRPATLEELAFWPVSQLSRLLKKRQVSSLELTEMYLARLRRFGPQLECVVTVTEELALEQARRADEELARGVYRSPLHGIPWGAKDLLATKGYPTTWGATPWRDQVLDVDATVVQRLEGAGAVLIAKLTLGALANGDVWFGGLTRNPWNMEEGSSGSSAGSASATVAGLVGFSIGSETLGSIVSPSARCGATGLRPTFGRISRHGAMTLSWSMDKLGPICRSVEDCALVLGAIYGPDGRDPTVSDSPFTWLPRGGMEGTRIGYVASAFAPDGSGEDEDEEERENNVNVLATLRSLGAELCPVHLPEDDLDAANLILLVETAAAFDEMTRHNLDDQLVRQVESAWPNQLRSARFIPAVEYIQANRFRTHLMQEMDDLMEDIDLLVTPCFAGKVLPVTNLTGHPALALPNGFRANGTPTSVSFIGKLDQEAELLAAARVYQEATGFHRQHPPQFTGNTGG
ncbi:MAG: amidase [Anaerolineaceae bacterium]|nr:amidase [Anaerolineaceae bacterium]